MEFDLNEVENCISQNCGSNPNFLNPLGDMDKWFVCHKPTLIGAIFHRCAIVQNVIPQAIYHSESRKYLL